MEYNFIEIGACGISCFLCPNYVSEAKSRCPGCKSEWRLGAACPILRCSQKRNIGFCGDCEESSTCEKWKTHREMGKKYDSFKCYQKLEDDIAFIQKYGLVEFKKSQVIRERLLRQMLSEFNEGRSKSYYCIVATILEVSEIEEALKSAQSKSVGLGIKEKAKILHTIFDDIAQKKNYHLKLRRRK